MFDIQIGKENEGAQDGLTGIHYETDGVAHFQKCSALAGPAQIKDGRTTWHLNWGFNFTSVLELHTGTSILV